MTSFIEMVGVFLCGALFGAAVAIQLMETYGLLRPAGAVTDTAVALAAEENLRQESTRPEGPRTAKKPRRTPWRKVKARYEAEHRRTRQSVEERVQEMEQQ